MLNINKLSYNDTNNCVHFEIKGMIRFVSATLMRLAHSVLRNSPRVEGNLLSKAVGLSLNPNGQVICLLYMSDRIRTMLWRVLISKLI